MRRIRSKTKVKAETFGERMNRHHREFENRFTEIAGRPPTFKERERERGYGMYYTDHYGPWEAAQIIAEDR